MEPSEALPDRIDSAHAATIASAAPRRPGIWSGIGTVVLYFVMQFVMGIVVGVVIGIVLAVRAGMQAGLHHQKSDTLAILQSLRSNPDIRVILIVVSIAAAAAVMTLIVYWIWPAQWARPDPPGFGFVRARKRSDYLIAVVSGVLLLFLGGFLTQVLAHGHPVHQDISVLFAKAAPGLQILLLLMAVCAAPFVEELVFRGVLLSGLMRRMPAGWAILISALIFGCAHLPDFKFAWYAIPALVIMGLALAWMRLRSRSLWPAVTLHATNNLVATVVWFLAAHH
ncbi:MAG TPA: CPBP family intramembrane glutamic endopeptidase [Rhodanobacteraceae bacterium]|nr:CPBP family intramembrane glutamic endopeptidase [Rhodanobacteraceae bacterium]